MALYIRNQTFQGEYSEVEAFLVLSVTLCVLLQFLLTLSLCVSLECIIYVLGSRSHSQLSQEPHVFHFLHFSCRLLILV